MFFTILTELNSLFLSCTLDEGAANKLFEVTFTSITSTFAIDMTHWAKSTDANL